MTLLSTLPAPLQDKLKMALKTVFLLTPPAALVLTQFFQSTVLVINTIKTPQFECKKGCVEPHKTYPI